MEKTTNYEDKKRALRMTMAREREMRPVPDEFDRELYEGSNGRLHLSDVAQVGSKILIGGGVGVLAGVATIAVAASAAEVIIAGVITKVAGIIGGAVGLSFGVNKFLKVKKKRNSEDY